MLMEFPISSKFGIDLRKSKDRIQKCSICLLDVINGVDEIENPIAIWTINNGELVQTYTDKMEWPNTTYDGKTIYENTYFDSKEKAIEYAIREYSAGVSIMERSVNRISKDLKEANDSLEMYRSWVDKFKGMSEK